MKKRWLIAGLMIVALIFMLTTAFATTIEFWTTETQSDRTKTIQLLSIVIFKASLHCHPAGCALL